MLKNNTYRIISKLGEGGFGVTYLAEHIAMKRKVCIKEFFIRKYCARDAMQRVQVISPVYEELTQSLKQKFVKEASVLGTLDHPNIVRVHDSFTENNSAYYVMEYIDGKSLSDIIKERGSLKEEDALTYINEIASALAYIHKRNMLHLDIKPSNIMVRKRDNRAILIDFGLTKHYDESSGELTTPSSGGVSDGYTPIEQYNTSISHFTPETDIYSLGATLYAAVSGKQPPHPDAIDMANFPGASMKMSQRVRNTIKRSMQYESRNRPHSIEEFSKLLTPKKRRAWGWIVACCSIGVISAVAAVIAVGTFMKEEPTPTPQPNDISVAEEAPTTKEEQRINEAIAIAKEYASNDDYAAAFSHWEEAAELGNEEAMMALADYYYYGHGMAKDLEMAIYWYEKVAQNDNTTAMYNLGICYMQDSDIRDYDKSVEWMTKAAEHGHLNAQYTLGRLYLYSDGTIVAMNPNKGIEWLSKAHDNGHNKAAYEIAIYLDGSGEKESAVEWFKRGAMIGNIDAQHALGVYYFNGEGGLKVDHETAASWYQRAANNGHEGAILKLADCYDNGWGVEKDRNRAKELRASLEETSNE
jgi:serine/threonine protein kinase